MIRAEEGLVDLKDVMIDTSLPVKERIADYVRQIKNPYCFICNGVVVKISFSGTKTLEECLSNYLKISGGSYGLGSIKTFDKEAS